ncbi:mitochondrial proton/calcium exchanger protein [Lutzomyia longipalpis]|uniref:mitochondrial proton/calcium exchanger protein n=1 Tax=Lutzomyia longipalpis TaxID=7200 RepID=UPI0024843690|nr:mitochondrial proton/calcium exchanger protein [Lutzomyia longipalpis]
MNVLVRRGNFINCRNLRYTGGSEGGSRLTHNGTTLTRRLSRLDGAQLNLPAYHWRHYSANALGAVTTVPRDIHRPPVRSLSVSARRLEQPSSKVEETVKSIKQENEVKAKATEAEAATVAERGLAPVPEKAVVKKSIGQRVWAEILHYYHGFRLLGIDMRVSCKLLWKILNGEKLTRREYQLLIRTTSDLFRLVPFSVFIIVPFMELLLPVFIKFFPGMLPSTFQTAKDRDDKLKQNLKVKLEMAKFLQRTLDEMSVQHKEHRSEAAKDFSMFVAKTREAGEPPAPEEIMKFSKLFADEITLDSLSRQQLMAICRVLEVGTIGTNAFLRFQLRMKLRTLAVDDRMIQKEGVDALNYAELQAACRSRGMRAYGMSEERLKQQLVEWIDLSLNEKVPPSLLLLSRAMMLPEHIPTSDKLKATISVLPEQVVAQTKAAIGEREGKIDNRTKLEIIKEEVRKIKEEKDEETETAAQVEASKKDAEELIDKAQTIILESAMAVDKEVATVLDKAAEKPAEISSKDLEVLTDALGEISKDKKVLLVEKEQIKDLKEEIADYAEDVKELNAVVKPTDKIHESTAAKLLHKRVNKMIGKLDKVLEDLEKKEQKLKSDIEHIASSEEELAQKEKEQQKEKEEQLVYVDELMLAIKKIQKVDDDSKIHQIYGILGKLDDDRDGRLKVDDVLKVMEMIAKDNVKLSEKQFDELLELIAKEEILGNEDKIEKEMNKQLAAAKEEAATALPPPAAAEKVDAMQKKLIVDPDTVTEAVERQKEKILPSNGIPPIPPPLPSASGEKTKNSKTL